MDDAEILSEMIKQSARIELQEEYGKFLVELREPQAPDSLAVIRNVPSDAIVIKVDCFRSPNDIFVGDRGECKRSDYVIISHERKRIIHCEIKRTREADGWGQVVRQLMGSDCFMKYCREVGRAFWGKESFLDGYQHRFVCIRHTSVVKRKTRISIQPKPHDTPGRAMTIDTPNHLQFNQLA